MTDYLLIECIIKNLFSFRISIINENHVISVTAFVNHANYFKINPAKILDECKL